MKLPTRTDGFSLVELMVAMVLGLFLAGAIGGTYLLIAQSRLTIQSRSLLMESMNYAGFFIHNDINRAGSVGCINLDSGVVNTLNSSTSYDYNFAVPVSGFNATGSGWSPAGLSPAISAVAQAGSDILAVRARTEPPIPVSQPLMATTTAPLAIGATIGVATGDLVVVSDCTAAAVFQVTGTVSDTGNNRTTLSHALGGGTPGNSTTDLQRLFRTDAEVNRIETISYFVGIEPASGLPGLYRRRGTNTPELLVYGVENMQILYGIGGGANNSANQYVTANNVANWAQVVALRIAMLIRSEETIRSSNDTQLYPLLDTTVGPMNDRRSRQLYNTTITLRNRLL